MTSLSEQVVFEQRADVASLELRKPEKRNAVTLGIWEAIAGHLHTAAADPDVRVLIVRGSRGYFCSGADLATLQDSRGHVPPETLAQVSTALSAIAAFPAPTVAQAEGPCIGGGCAIALACDVRFAHPDALFSVPAARYGVVYDRRSTAKLLSLVGPSAAARMLYAGESIRGGTALRIGLVDECGERVAELVQRFVEGVLAGQAQAISGMKAMLQSAQSSSEEDAAGW